jgi:hypothetical protein
LTVAALVVLGDADAASRGAIRVSTYLFVLAMVAVAAYACVLASTAQSSTLRNCVVAFGASSACMQVLGVMPRAALNLREATTSDEQVMRLVLDLGHVTNFYSDLVLAGFLVSGTVVLLKDAHAGRWAYIGFAGAAAAVVAAATQGGPAGFLTLVTLLAWLVGGSLNIVSARETPSLDG